MPARATAAVRSPSRWYSPSFAVAAAAAVLVISLIGWRMLSVEHPAKPSMAQAPQPVPSPAQATPSPSQPATAGPVEPQLIASNSDLGSIVALPYRPSVLRGANEDASQRFQKAMASYQDGDYRKAVANLSTIPVAVPGSGNVEDYVTDAGVQMYLGVSQLMLNQNADAVRSLRRAGSYGDTPYLESAGFFLAKALIRQKQYAAATVELERTIQLNGDRQAEATKLLHQVIAASQLR